MAAQAGMDHAVFCSVTYQTPDTVSSARLLSVKLSRQ